MTEHGLSQLQDQKDPIRRMGVLLPPAKPSFRATFPTITPCISIGCRGPARSYPVNLCSE